MALAADKDELVAAGWNIQHNGRGRTGTEDHRDAARTLLASYKPHIVWRQELTGAWENGRSELHAEANALGGLIPYMSSPKEGRSRNPVGVMVDPDVFLIDNDFEHEGPWKSFRHVRVRLRRHRTSRPFNIASGHLCHFDPATRATEARRLTALADHGQSVLMELDANSYPHHDSEAAARHPHLDGYVTALPDWEQVEDRVHYEQRTIERDGIRVSDTVPDEILTGGKEVFTDLALHAATALRQPTALRPTASLQRTDQGHAQRIDIAYGTPDLTPALKSVEIVATSEVSEITDHGLVIVRFDLPTFGTILAAAR
ncbi:endonuclease/exonuclease/phosphatase family protein [Streptomyces sp. SID13726]|uniref:endonuclease/exonuclease/phosphatase family protein n=1 Tax=Streptomyces sp. SID13726 TaxID=2706058 RepID=UPI0013B954E5|nr:endonuclease/exonuclease/phosphatase family protein [Streptomyces sp. SID13726]NEB01881.1 endonuclease/exonuclease/phosphatase family protein [Streptomyces sp. SID13726]